MASSVVSGRVDERVRLRADAVIRKAGLTPTEIIQNVWRSIADTGEIPAEVRPTQASQAEVGALDRLDGFLASLPSPNPDFSEMSDDDILAMKVLDYA